MPLGLPLIRPHTPLLLLLRRVNATADGVGAVVKLGGGDMRKTLNILQSSVMSVGGSASLLDEAAVYSCTGSPLPADIDALLNWLMNENFADAYQHIRKLQEDKGLALLDITRELTPYAPSLRPGIRASPAPSVWQHARPVAVSP